MFLPGQMYVLTRSKETHFSSAQEPTESSKQPIRARYLGHVTSYQPIRDQYFLIRSVPAAQLYTVLFGLVLVWTSFRVWFEKYEMPI